MIRIKKILSKTKTKAIFSTVLAVLMLLAPEIIFENAIIYVSAESEAVYSTASQLTDTDQKNYDLIYHGLINRLESITIFSEEKDDDWINNNLTPLYFRVIYENPELFYVGLSVKYKYRYNYNFGFQEIYITPEYSMSGSELDSARAEYEAGVQRIIEGIDPSWSDVEKVVYVNDYIASHFSYDTDLNNYDAYSFFRDGKGVCQAYSAVFIAAMNELNIPVSYAISESMNHMWNLVQVDGQWYHIDVTWNDPLPDIPSRVRHTNLLLSDEGIAKTEHENWTADYTCSSTKYDNYFWKDYKTSFVFAGDKVYSVKFDMDDGGVYSVDLDSGTENLVFRIKDKWYVEGSSTRFWTGCYSSIGVYNEYICYSTPKEIMVYSTKSKTHDSVYTYSGSGSIYGIHVDGKTVTYYVGESPNEEINKSGTVTLQDLVKYKLTYMLDDEVYITQTYKAGDKIIKPDNPSKEGYTFKGWTPSLPSTMPEKDLTVQAVFECAHSNTHVERKEATCAEDGYVRIICDNCGEIVSEEIIPATEEHSFGDWVVVEEPTEDSEGIRQKTCKVCGKVVTETIPPLPAVSEAVSTTSESEPTVSDTAMTTSETNSVVSETFSINSETNQTTNQNSIISEGESKTVEQDNESNTKYIYIVACIIFVGIVVLVIVVVNNRKRRQ